MFIVNIGIIFPLLKCFRKKIHKFQIQEKEKEKGILVNPQGKGMITF